VHGMGTPSHPRGTIAPYLSAEQLAAVRPWTLEKMLSRGMLVNGRSTTPKTSSAAVWDAAKELQSVASQCVVAGLGNPAVSEGPYVPT
jgi:hypothetical protein